MALSEYLKKLSIKTIKQKDENSTYLVLGNLEKKEFDENYYLLSPFEADEESVDFFAKYEVGSEEGVLALLLNFCHVKSDGRLEDFLEELDFGYLSAECNFGEEEAEELSLKIQNEKICLFVCKDLEFHQNAQNIAKLLSMIKYYCKFDLVYESFENNISRSNLHTPQIIEELQSFDGAVVYFVSGDKYLFGSHQFAMSNKIKHEDKVKVRTKQGEFERTFILNEELKGTIGLFEYKPKDTYAYEVCKITRIANG